MMIGEVQVQRTSLPCNTMYVNAFRGWIFSQLFPRLPQTCYPSTFPPHCLIALSLPRIQVNRSPSTSKDCIGTHNSLSFGSATLLLYQFSQSVSPPRRPFVKQSPP
jgi:hypothetical protein